MPIYTIKLVGRKAVADNTMQFDFEKPEGFTFIPGQYGGFTLVNPTETDEKGINRRFSLASSPDDSVLSIVTRIQTSAYKKVLTEMPIGSEIKFAGPTGKFVMHENIEQPAILIAGGIGIAPFYSMIKHAAKHQSSHNITLFYGNENIDATAYMNELEQLSENMPLTVINTLANPPETWSGENGYITHTMIKKHVPDIMTPMFYVCGSPAMVQTLHETLQEMDIPEEHIQVEDFPGY